MNATQTVSRLLKRRFRSRPPAAEDRLLAQAAPSERLIVERSAPYTMTTPAQRLALIDAVRYCVARGIPGAFAECGVWLGGSVLAMILTLQQLSASDREIYLFDTFEGMTTPTELDVSQFEDPALKTWRRAVRSGERPWGGLFGPEVFSEDRVRSLLLATGYPSRLLRFVGGRVEETLPAHAPPQLALLRLDTDWYESTRHEMEHLFPRLSVGGVLIVDDYGHWQGARRAVDEYFGARHPPVLLHRIDYTARIAIKH